jgi:beta-glucanase (GH16 family)
LTEAQKLTDDQLCLIMSDDFSSSLDESIWSPQVELGGFENGEFEMTTDNVTNLRIVDGELYLTPTITTEDFPGLDIFNGGNYTLEGCTDMTNRSACSVRTNPSTGTIINPVRSARINTKGKKEIKYGRVEVRAKFPLGYVPPLPSTNTVTHPNAATGSGQA